MDHVLSELNILRMISQPFIVTLHGYTQDSRFIYLMLEYVAGGEMFTYLRSIGHLSSLHARFYAAQVVSIFEYLHSKSIVYRDLKPENILIAATGYLKLTDFGFAKLVESRTYTLCGTPEYLAPEILLNKGHGKPVDWWTLGILIYEMLVGIDPFSDEDPMNVYHKILKGKINFPKHFDKNARSLVKHLLVADLSKRYGNLRNGVSDIKNHRWFLGMDWARLLTRTMPPPYTPAVRSTGDTSHFAAISEVEKLPDPIRPQEDPFLEW